jgi:hypothetical protein
MALNPDRHERLHSPKRFGWSEKWRDFVRRRETGTTADAVYRYLEKLKAAAAKAFQKELGA